MRKPFLVTHPVEVVLITQPQCGLTLEESEMRLKKSYGSLEWRKESVCSSREYCIEPVPCAHAEGKQKRFRMETWLIQVSIRRHLKMIKCLISCQICALHVTTDQKVIKARCIKVDCGALFFWQCGERPWRQSNKLTVGLDTFELNYLKLVLVSHGLLVKMTWGAQLFVFLTTLPLRHCTASGTEESGKLWWVTRQVN